jgi:hypothetical protein
MSYIINNNGKRSGPFSEAQVKDILKLGLPEALYSEDDGVTWTPLSRFGLAPAPAVDPTTEELSHRSSPTNPTTLRPNQLRRCPLFAEMSDDQILQFAALMEQFSLKPFEPIVKFGTKTNSLFILLEGEAHISMPLAGKQEMLKTISTGDFVGEMAMWDDGVRSASVIADKNCTVLRLTKHDLLSIVREKPDIAAPFLLAMNRILCQRIRENNERFLKAKHFAHTIRGDQVHGVIYGD